MSRLLLDNKVGEKLYELLPRHEGQLDPISHRRLDEIMTRAIRAQVRLNSACTETPQGEVNERACPHCALGREETTEHIFWDCTYSADLRALTTVHLDQVLLQSPARAGMPSEWSERPAPLRAFGIIGLDDEVDLAMKELPTQRVKGPSL